MGNKKIGDFVRKYPYDHCGDRKTNKKNFDTENKMWKISEKDQFRMVADFLAEDDDEEAGAYVKN